MDNNVYVTYNKGSEIERLTAFRMQAIGNLHGIIVRLPSRAVTRVPFITEETDKKIKSSRFVLAFCVSKLTKELQIELLHAMKLKKHIIIVYHIGMTKTLNFGGYKNVKEIFIDYNNSQKALSEIADYITGDIISKSKESIKEKKSDAAIAVGLIGLALGMLVLWSESGKR